MRKQYLEQLNELKVEVIELFNLVNENVKLIELALDEKCDVEDKIKESETIDSEVRRKTADIESFCIQLLSLQSPMARDLRLIVATLKFLTDFERISRNTLHTLEELSKIHPLKYTDYSKVIFQLINVIDFMLQEIYTAISRDSPSNVETLADSDNIIDLRYEELSTKIYEDLKEDKISMKQSLALVYIVRYLERIGDHICNIGERLFYSEKGEKTTIK
jgi:phosphate transport system protein